MDNNSRNLRMLAGQRPSMSSIVILDGYAHRHIQRLLNIPPVFARRHRIPRV